MPTNRVATTIRSATTLAYGATMPKKNLQKTPNGEAERRMVSTVL